MLPLIVALLFAGGAAAQAPVASARPEPTRPGLTWSDADSLAHKIADVLARAKSGQPIPAQVVREGELNSYLNLSLASQMPPGVGELEIHFEKDRIAAKGTVDLDKMPIKAQAASSPWSPINFLSGRVPVELRAKLKAEDGFGTFEPEELRLATVPLPTSLLVELVASATRTRENPQGFDLLSPFRLPYSAKRVRLQPGKALLDF